MMKLIVSMFLLIILSACSSIRPINKVTEKKAEVEGPIVNRPVEVEVQPGKITYVEFDINLAEGRWDLTCKNKKIPFVVLKNKAQLLLAESYFSNLKPYTCTYTNDTNLDDVVKTVVMNVTPKKFKYKSERLYVDKRRIDIKGKDLERVIKEKEIKKNIYKESASYFLFDKPFKVPLDSYITSYYGNKRIFNNKKQSQHLGNDFRAKVGVPIPSANKGRVIFTGDLFFIGKVVVVDHGLEIFSVYGHLSKIKVAKGDLVDQGDIIGLSGKTGRVSGPHLHWGVRVQNQWVDGFSLVEQSNLKFNP